MHRHSILAGAVTAFALVAVAPRAADAKREFVYIIAGYPTPRAEAPPCRICHIQGTTGAGSVQTPFGVSMLAHGMTSSEDTVLPALEAMAADQTDSDGDTVPDVTELSMNTDPNTPVPTPLTPSEPSPTYGCAVAVPPSPRASDGLASPLGGSGAGLLAVLIMARGRRARRR